MQFDPDRFIAAQRHAYDDAVRELRAGRKTSHWMWFVFPQLRGLGRSEASRFYGLASLEEARAYAGHPLLGARLRECTDLVNAHAGTAIDTLLGAVDALKFRSSMTLFLEATSEPLFRMALDTFYDGVPDEATLTLLGRDRVGGEVTLTALSHHRTCGSAYGGSSNKLEALPGIRQRNQT